jgi:hypothetical protein
MAVSDDVDGYVAALLKHVDLPTLAKHTKGDILWANVSPSVMLEDYSDLVADLVRIHRYPKVSVLASAVKLLNKRLNEKLVDSSDVQCQDWVTKHAYRLKECVSLLRTKVQHAKTGERHSTALKKCCLPGRRDLQAPTTTQCQASPHQPRARCLRRQPKGTLARRREEPRNHGRQGLA